MFAIPYAELVLETAEQYVIKDRDDVVVEIKKGASLWQIFFKQPQ